VLKGRKVIVGVTGGIAAYKTTELVRLLVKAHAEVRVVMTLAATQFVTALTFQALSGNPVSEQLLDSAAEAGMGHIELARWADLLVIAPATADFIARFRHGMANDLLSTICLATKAPVMLAPAMNQNMWMNSATMENISCLSSRIEAGEVIMVGPDFGGQACGDIGPGRMAEPQHLFESLQGFFAERLLQGRRVVITAGPTREALDPVRYISNHSSGKMGFALAKVASQMGAEVTLIAGPVMLPTPFGIHRVDVKSAEEMLVEAKKATLNDTDLFVASAAVADYRPASFNDQKIKKNTVEMTIDLVQNPDIVATIAAQSNRPFMVGFAAETEQVAAYARSKLIRKKLDMVIANDVSDNTIGFNSDENAVLVIESAEESLFKKMSKQKLAMELLTLIASRLKGEMHYKKEITLYVQKSKNNCNR